jgi:hypothetical protein
VRCRETFQREVTRSRHYILKFLRRRGFIFRNGHHWTARHFEWLRQLHAGQQLASEDRTVFGEYLALLEYKLSRRDERDRQIEALAITPTYQPIVARLRCFRAIDTHSAMVLATEVGDWRRFAHAEALMGLLRPRPQRALFRRSSAPGSDHQSRPQPLSTRPRAGRLELYRHRHRPAVDAALRMRQRGQDPLVIAHAWKAQHRCDKLFHRIAAKRPPQIAAVAVARELVGFLWAVMEECQQETHLEKHAA